MPDGAFGEARPQYDIAKNDRGEVTIGMQFSKPAAKSVSIDPETEELVDTTLKSDTSRFGVALGVTLNPDTLEPTLDKVHLDYAFYPE